MTNKLWLITRTDDVCYDEFDSFLVYADSADQARRMVPHPDGVAVDFEEAKESKWKIRIWTTDLENVKVKFLGTSHEFEEAGTIVITSFNAG